MDVYLARRKTAARAGVSWQGAPGNRIFMKENKSSGVHNRLGFGKQFYPNRGFAFDPWTGMKPHNPSNKESDVFSLILTSPIL